MTLLAQADAITALEHLIVTVMDKAGGGGMLLVVFALGYICFPLSMKALRRLGIRIEK